jgi:hypothetical protein
VRHCFLETSSGDPALDEEARKYLIAARFPALRSASPTPPPSLTWGTATVEWGNDIASAPSSSPTPTAP